VSQIWALTVLSSTLIDRVANSTPMVDLDSRLNSFRVNRERTDRWWREDRRRQRSGRGLAERGREAKTHGYLTSQQAMGEENDEMPTVRDVRHEGEGGRRRSKATGWETKAGKGDELATDDRGSPRPLAWPLAHRLLPPLLARQAVRTAYSRLSDARVSDPEHPRERASNAGQ
jgi:hypothetical protein